MTKIIPTTKNSISGKIEKQWRPTTGLVTKILPLLQLWRKEHLSAPRTTYYIHSSRRGVILTVTVDNSAFLGNTFTLRKGDTIYGHSILVKQTEYNLPGV